MQLTYCPDVFFDFRELGWRITVIVLSIFCIVFNDLRSETKLTAGDAETGDNFGWSVDIDGEYAIVGAYHDDDNGRNSGAVYFYEWDGTAWGNEQKMTAHDGASYDEFGYSVAIHGELAIVGAHRDDDNGSSSGSAYIYLRNSTGWAYGQKISAGSADDRFGISVDIDGDYAVIGAAYDDDNASNAGAAYVYTWNPTTFQWEQQAKISAVDGDIDDLFATSVSLSGPSLLIGAHFDDPLASNSGSAYLFRRSGSVWTQEQKLQPAIGAADDYFGASVALSGDLAVIGAYQRDHGASNTGAAYVFRYSGGSWTEETMLTASDAAAGDNFAYSIAAIDDAICVGARYTDNNDGSAYIFHHESLVWREVAKLKADDGSVGSGFEFGWNVALNRSQAIVGARLNGNQGAAYVYKMAVEAPAVAAHFPCSVSGEVAGEIMILHEGSLSNYSGANDRLIGAWCSQQAAYIPCEIRWDYPCNGTVTDPVYEFCTTNILYPDWEKLSISFSLLDLGLCSCHEEFVFALSGELDGEKQNRIIVVFTEYLSHVDAINLGDILTNLNQEHVYTSPYLPESYLATELVTSGTYRQLVEPEHRDYTGKLSYRVLHHDELPPPLIAPETTSDVSDSPADFESTVVKVYPNPVSADLRIEAQKIPPGSYTIELFSSEGSLHQSRTINVNASGKFMQYFDLSLIPAGYYTARLYTARQFFGAYPVVIVR